MSGNEYTIGLIMTVIFGVLMAFPWLSLLRRLKRCTAVVEAEIVDIKEHYSQDSDGTTTHTYAPVYGYYYEGCDYRETAKTYSNLGKVRIGDRVELRIDPEKPTYFLDKKRSIGHAVFLTVIFGVFVAVGIILIKRP